MKQPINCPRRREQIVDVSPIFGARPPSAAHEASSQFTRASKHSANPTERVMQIVAPFLNSLNSIVSRHSIAGVLLAMVGLFGVAPAAQAQIKNGGFETQNFSEWKLERYTRSNVGLSSVPPTSGSQLTLGGVLETYPSTNTMASAFSNNVRILTTPGTAESTNGNGAKYPFSGAASALLGGNGGYAAYALEQTATMVLSDVDPVDGKVHIRFAMAPVLNNPGHPAERQPFFFVEVINLTKGNTQLFNTFNYSNQTGIPWQSFGDYQFTNWQGFDIAPGNGRLDVGDQVRLKIYVSNCADGRSGQRCRSTLKAWQTPKPSFCSCAHTARSRHASFGETSIWRRRRPGSTPALLQPSSQRPSTDGRARVPPWSRARRAPGQSAARLRQSALALFPAYAPHASRRTADTGPAGSARQMQAGSGRRSFRWQPLSTPATSSIRTRVQAACDLPFPSP